MNLFDPRSLEALDLHRYVLLKAVVSHELVEGLIALDVNRLNREGFLQTGSCRYRDFPYDVDRSLRARIVVPDDETIVVQLFERDQPSSGQTIRLTSTTPNYGGRRRYFVCPGKHCGRRVAKLYLEGWLFACRHCVGLTYQSQRMTAPERALERSKRLRVAAGDFPIVVDDFPDRPRGMHRTTYERLKEQAAQAQSEFNTAQIKSLRRLRSQAGLD